MHRLLIFVLLAACQSSPDIVAEAPPHETPPPEADGDAEPALPGFEIPEDAEQKSADRDGDGAEELLVSWYSGGSGFGGVTCVLDDPARGERWQVDTFAYFGSPVDVTAEPEGLSNEALREALMDCATGPLAPQTVPMSWWLGAFEAHVLDTSSGAISARWTVPTTWHDGSPAEKADAVIRVAPQDVQPWMRSVFEDEAPELDATGLRFSYRGPGEFKEVAKRGKAVLLTTAHDVVLKRGGRYAYLFTSDGRWGGTDKRRHDSIAAAGFVDDGLIWALQTSGTAAHTVWLLRENEQLGVTLSDLAWTAEPHWEELPMTFTARRTSSGVRFEAGSASATVALP